MPLFESKSKKAFKHNIKEEVKAGKPLKQSLAISYNVQKKNSRKKMADGGKTEFQKNAEASDAYYNAHPNSIVDALSSKPTPSPSPAPNYADGGQVANMKENYSKDQFKSKPKKFKPIGDKYGVDGEEHPKGLEEDNDQIRPTMTTYMGKDWAGGKNMTPMNDSNDTRSKKEYDGERAVNLAYGGKAEYDGAEHPKGLEEDDDQIRPSVNDYESDDATHGTIEAPSTSMKPPEKEYMAGHFAEGGAVPCAHCGHNPNPKLEQSEEEPSIEGTIAEQIMHKRKKMAEGGMAEGDNDEYLNEEGPGVDLEHNEDAKEFKTDDYEDLSQPEDSNEHSDTLEDEDENDHITRIMKKMRTARG